MQPTRSPSTEFLKHLRLQTVVREQGLRAVIDFAPKPTSPERLCAGVVTRTEAGKVSFMCAIDARKIEHAFGEPGVALHAIASTLCTSLANHWNQNEAAETWQPPFEGARIALLDPFSAATAAEAHLSILGRVSTMQTLLEDYEIKQTLQPKGIVERVKSVVSKDPNSKHLAPRFGRELSLGGEAQSLKVDFLGTHFACYFLQITDKERGLDANTDRALARLYSLQALRKFIQKPRKSLGLLDDERPETFELMMIGNRNNAVQRRAIYQVEALADKGNVRAIAIPTVHEVAELVSSKERLAA